MIRLTLLALVGALLVAASAQAKTGDPRKCVLNDARACAQENAIVQLKAAMKRRTGQMWDANVSCSSKPKWLTWRCSWTSGTPGSATITYRATHTGWHVTVTTKGG